MLCILSILSIIYFFLITNAQPYNIIFLKGSQIKNEFYYPFLRKLQTELDSKNLPQNPTVKFGGYFTTSPPPSSSIIIGHSFGGFFGLIQAMKYPDYIKGCVLINSHFNQRLKMPYNPIYLDKISQPTLILLNQQDEKLPLSKAMDDYHVYQHPNLPNYSTTPRKEFRIRPGTHTSSFTNPSEIQQTVSEIVRFIETLDTVDNTHMPDSEENTKIEQICYWQLPNTRTYYHLPTFLASKPGLFNCLYYPGNLYKTRDLNEEQLKQELTREIHSLFASAYPLTPIALLPEIRFKKTYFPLGEKYSYIQTLRNGLFMYSLTNWLSQEPQIIYSTTPSPHLVIELFVIPIIDNTIYYKLPNKLHLMELFL
jgi:hypothetical protein